MVEHNAHEHRLHPHVDLRKNKEYNSIIARLLLVYGQGGFRALCLIFMWLRGLKMLVLWITIMIMKKTAFKQWMNYSCT